jgi:LysR family transcriptional regulator for bpeEF and oprC
MISNVIAADALKSGKLKTILPDYIVEGPDVSVVYLPRSNLSAKVKAFVEFLTLTVEGIERA